MAKVIMTSTLSSEQQQQDDDDVLLVHPIIDVDLDDDDDDDVEMITGTSTANTSTTSTTAQVSIAMNAATSTAAATIGTTGSSTTSSETTGTSSTGTNNNSNKNNKSNKWKFLFEKKLYLLNELSSKETYLSLVKWIEFNRQRMITDFIPILLQHFTMLQKQYFSIDTSTSTNNTSASSSSSLIRQGLYIQLLHELLIDEKDNNNSNTLSSTTNNNSNKKSKWDRFYDLRVMIGEHVLIPLLDDMILILLPSNNTNPTSTTGATTSATSTTTTTTINLHEKIVSYIKEWDELNVFETPTLIFQIKRKINISKQQQRKKQQQLQVLLQQQQEQEQAQQELEQEQVKAASVEAATAAVNDTFPPEPVTVVDDNDKEDNSETFATPSKRPISKDEPLDEEKDDDSSTHIQKKKRIMITNDDVDDVMEDDFVVVPAITSSVPNDSSTIEQEVSDNNSTAVHINHDTDHIVTSSTADTTDDPVIESITSTSHPTDVSSSDILVDSVTSAANTATVAIPSLSESNMTTTKPIAQSTIDDIDISSSPTATETITNIPVGSTITHSRRSSSTGAGTTIAGVPYDFEASGIPAETIDTRDIIDHCKAIATLQIARDVQNDSAVQLLSLLSSLPEDIKKIYMTTETDTDTATTVTTEPIFVLSDVQARDFSMRTNERIIQMNINDEINNIQTFYDIISRQQLARNNLIQLLIKSRCIYGSTANATAYTNTSSLMKQLLHRKTILLDSMELEGLDVEDDATTNTNTIKKDIDVEQLLPLPWFQPPDSTSATKTPVTAPTSSDDDPSLHTNIDTNESNDAKRQKVV